MVFNETPIRTSRNYGINNIKIENINFYENIDKFNGLNIKEISENVQISYEKMPNEFKYGNGIELDAQIKEKSNIDIQIKVQDDSNLDLEFKLSKQNPNLIKNMIVEVEENAKANLIIRYQSEDEDLNYQNVKIKVTAKSNSKLNIIILNMLNARSNNFLAIENVLEDNANVEYTIVDFGAKNSITNYYTNLKGNNSNNQVNTIYLGNDEQIIDLNYIVEVYGKNSTIDMDLKGAIKDKCKKHFKGTIDFKKGCKKSKGNEIEYCTILSDTAKSIALPMLLCTEEDIEGNHSAAAGKIDNKQLFYLMSRGFSLKEAQKLIVRANFNKIIEKIENEEIRNIILEKIEEKIK